MTMNADDVTNRLAKILADLPADEFSEDQVYRAMDEAGISSTDGDRAYKFGQIAATRVALGDLDLKFAPNYFCLNAEGEIVEEGLLENEPSFIAAAHAMRESAYATGFARLAAISSEVNAINTALNSGSKPANLVLSPPAIFLEAPTDAGLEAARLELTRRVKAGSPNRPAGATQLPRPWWRFW